MGVDLSSLKRCDQCKVVTAEALEAETGRGWRLVHPVEDEVVVGADGDHNYRTIQVGGEPQPCVPVPAFTTLHKRRRVRFLVRLNEESVVAKLHTELDLLRYEVEHVGTRLEEATLEAKKHLAEVERLRANLVQAHSEGKMYRQRLATRRNLEEDLAKLRKAIGDIEYDKIVNK